jgi:hypothetical protein
VKSKFQLPAGSVRETTYVTPPANPELGPLIVYWPTPWTMTAIAVGAQPAASWYTTENVIVVAGVPLPGFAFPLESTGAAWEPPLQLAASTVTGAASADTAKHSPMTIEPARASVLVDPRVRSRSSVGSLVRARSTRP